MASKKRWLEASEKIAVLCDRESQPRICPFCYLARYSKNSFICEMCVYQYISEGLEINEKPGVSSLNGYHHICLHVGPALYTIPRGIWHRTVVQERIKAMPDEHPLFKVGNEET